jgi:hypothetical protein
MDLEQLKLVLEAINSVGGEAKEFGLWWLAARTIPAVLWFTFGMTAVVVITRTINHGIRTSFGAYTIAEEVGHRVFMDWDARDTQSVLEEIRRLKGGSK